MDMMSLLTPLLGAETAAQIVPWIPLGLGSVSILMIFRALSVPKRRRAARQGYELRPVLNAAERKVHADLRQVLRDQGRSELQVLAQVSLAEFLYSPAKEAYHAISGQRADLLIVDRGFRAVCVLELAEAGSGSRQAADASRQRRRELRAFDRRIAYREAGLPLIELPENPSAEHLALRIAELLPVRERPGRHLRAAG